MKFTFKRKYTLAFFILMLLFAISIGFYFIGPKFIDQNDEFFNQILWISLADSTLIVIFILGLYRVNYYLFHDHITIHKSLHKPIFIRYNQITDVSENLNDRIFLIFGKRPSFKVTYLEGNKTKRQTIRIGDHDLFKLVLENERNIHINDA